MSGFSKIFLLGLLATYPVKDALVVAAFTVVTVIKSLEASYYYSKVLIYKVVVSYFR